MRTVIVFTVLFAMNGCQKAIEEETEIMKLRVISDYGRTERLVADEATPEIVVSTMHSLDWRGFHQVVLERSNSDWMEVGGSLDPSDGLSVMYEENGKQSVIRVAPTTVEDMTTMLLGYLSGTEDWKKSAKWD
jgi:hypothetical protein